MKEELKAKLAAENEKVLTRKKYSADIIQFKLKKHKDAIKEVFRRYYTKINPLAETVPPLASITVKEVKTLFSDLSYLSGTVFCFSKEFDNTNNYAGVKDTSRKFLKKFKHYLWRYLHDFKIVNDNPFKRALKRTFRGVSPEGYFDVRPENPRKVHFEDEIFKRDKNQTTFDYRQFKRALRQFIQDKKVVAVDHTNEYTKFMKKKDKEQVKNDLKAHLQKTIEEYEQHYKQTEDE